MLDREGFRPNVGIVLLNSRNQVFWGKRLRTHSWQFPQGGIKYGETPEQAMFRELHEEVGLRPEHAELGTATQHVLRTVQWQERLGEATYLYLDSGVAGEPWVAKAPGNAFAKAGERVALSLPAQHLHVFDATGMAVPRTIADADLRVSAAVS